MFQYFMGIIEKKMGKRFAYALKTTLLWSLRVLSLVSLVLLLILDMVCVIGIFVDGVIFGLYLILFLFLSVVALFATIWSFWEDWWE